MGVQEQLIPGRGGGGAVGLTSCQNDFFPASAANKGEGGGGRGSMRGYYGYNILSRPTKQRKKTNKTRQILNNQDKNNKMVAVRKSGALAPTHPPPASYTYVCFFVCFFVVVSEDLIFL